MLDGIMVRLESRGRGLDSQLSSYQVVTTWMGELFGM